MEQYRPQEVNTENLPDPESQEKKSRIERVKEKASKFMKRTRQVALILGLGMAVNNIEIHSTDVTETQENGKEVYSHTDKETTHILNYVAGLDSMTHEERLVLLKNGLRGAGLIQTPDGFDQMTEEQIASLILDATPLTSSDSQKTRQELLREEIEAFDDVVPVKYEYNETLYKTLWETERECGSPKVRWTFGHDRNLLLSSKGTGESHYNSLTHTVSINAVGSHLYRGPVKELVSEWPHSKQFHDNYISTTIGMIQSGARMAKDVLETHSFIKSQLKEYDIPGSVENEAHSVIETYLGQKFDTIKGIQVHFKKD